jgi:hypothetical protein
MNWIVTKRLDSLRPRCNIVEKGIALCNTEYRSSVSIADAAMICGWCISIDSEIYKISTCNHLMHQMMKERQSSWW